MPYKLNIMGKTLLLISDTHIPYSHPDYIKFLSAIKRELSPDVVLHGGDEVDKHAMSFHSSDADLFSAGHELDKSIIEIQEGLHKLWPKLYLCESNHGSLLLRKAKHHGIPIRVLKPLSEIYETPRWEWHHDYMLITDNGMVYVCHGKTSAYGKLAREMGCSAIQFHFHGKAEITYHRTATGTRFNMYCGCLVDEDSLAMAYASNNIPKPVLSVGWIEADGTPRLIRMVLNKEGRWNGKITLS